MCIHIFFKKHKSPFPHQMTCGRTWKKAEWLSPAPHLSLLSTPSSSRERKLCWGNTHGNGHLLHLVSLPVVEISSYGGGFVFFFFFKSVLHPYAKSFEQLSYHKTWWICNPLCEAVIFHSAFPQPSKLFLTALLLRSFLPSFLIAGITTFHPILCSVCTQDTGTKFIQ